MSRSSCGALTAWGCWELDGGRPALEQTDGDGVRPVDRGREGPASARILLCYWCLLATLGIRIYLAVFLKVKRESESQRGGERGGGVGERGEKALLHVSKEKA